MWLSMNMISKMVDVSGITPEDLALRLTMSTAEIDGIEYMNRHLASMCTVKILDVKKHPNADKLTVVDIDTGKEKLVVVCGAPNTRKGDITAYAPPGTLFPGDFVIKKASIRGVESAGMLCSEKEMGISEDHTGIKVFPENTKIGAPLSELYPEWVDVRLEIDNKSITHRPDLWSHIGFAREIGALLRRPVRDIIDRSLEKEFKSSLPLAVNIVNPEAAPRYSGLVMKNIKIAESPDWLKAHVTAIGMRPINNIVDVTNFVMAEVGEPMHAFDRKKLRGEEIIVRLAKPGETITTLDGRDFELNPEDIVIADKSGAVALAGVMGGANSEIEDNTSEIVLEAANFNPVNIRKTAQRYSQRTEAAMRFEKALSPDLTIMALIRCYDIIRQIIPGSEAASSIVDAYPKKSLPVHIDTTTDFIRKRLGEKIDDARILEILESLDFKIKKNLPKLSIDVPHYRATKDISIPEDIVEEIGRIYGYDNIAETPPQVPCAPPRRNEFRLFERNVKRILSFDHGMIEVSGYSFVGAEMLDKLRINEDLELKLANPLSVEHDRLRRSIVPNMIKHVTLNQKYHDQFQIYEQGRIYLKDDLKSPELAVEKTMVTGAFFRKKPDYAPFYDAKNTAVGVLEKLKVADFAIVPASDGLPPYCHPARSAAVMVGGKKAGVVFELHPDMKVAFDIAGQVSLFDLDLDLVYGAKKSAVQFAELQKFPEVPFELSVLADFTTYADDLITIIRKSDKRVKSAHVINVYEGDPLPKGKKSVSIKAVFASDERTLTTEEVAALQASIVGALGKKGFNLR